MNSVGADCDELKKEYDTCFNAWYTDHFLKGDRQSDPCNEIFSKYRACVMKAIKDKNINLTDIEENILGTEKEKQTPPGQ